MPSRIVRRIEAESGIAGLHDALTEKLPPTDFQSLLMEVCRTRAVRRKAPELAAQFARDPLLAPSAVSARVLLEFDSIAFEAAAGFDALDLSPACPFGASHLLGGTSQNNVLTAIRNVETLSDSTIAMAFEAARRRRLKQTAQLCASHRVVRLQPVDVPGFTPHFRLFALVSAGRDTGSHRFDFAQLVEHVGVYLRMFRLLGSAGYVLESPLVEFTDMAALEATLAAVGVTREEVREAVRAHWIGGSERFLNERGLALPSDARHAALEREAIEPLRAEFPEALFRVNQARLEGLGYYGRFALRISPQAPDGERYSAVDGGFTDWTARLLSNERERLLISGIGSEFVCKKYRKDAQSSGG